MLCGEIQRTEDEIRRLQESLPGLRTKVDALDSTLRLLEPRVLPEAGGVVRAVGGRYGRRGGLKDYIVRKLGEVGESGIDTTALAQFTAHYFGLHFSGQDEFSRFCVRSVTPTLKKLREDGLAERISKATLGPYPAVWRLKGTPPTLSELAALAKAEGTSA